MFKLDQLQFHAGVKQPNLQHAIYENVPGDLLTSPLLKEMTQAIEWKTLSPYNVVRVGRVRAQMRERDVIEQREKEQRLSPQSEPAQNKKNTRREHKETMRQHQRMVQTKNEQMKNDTRDWEQKNEEKRRKRSDQESREYENMYEQQHISPSTSQTGPPNSPKPSPKRRQAVTPKSTPSRARKSTLRSSVKKQPSPKSKSKKSAPHNNINIESVQKHVAALSATGVSHDMSETSRGESYGVTPIEGTVSNEPFTTLLEQCNGFTAMQLPTFDEPAGRSFEQRHGHTPMELPTFDDTADASFAQQQDFQHLFSGNIDGLEGLFPGEETGAGYGDFLQN